MSRINNNNDKSSILSNITTTNTTTGTGTTNTTTVPSIKTKRGLSYILGDSIQMKIIFYPSILFSIPHQIVNYTLLVGMGMLKSGNHIVLNHIPISIAETIARMICFPIV